MAIQINWQGPLKAGNLPKDRQEIEAMGLHHPGVYIGLQQYPRAIVIYVGKAGCLRKRIHDHLASFLGFEYWLRREDPDPRSSYQAELDKVKRADRRPLYLAHEYEFLDPEDHGLDCFNDLDTWLPKAVREAKAMTFYYCRYAETSDGNRDIPDQKPELKASRVVAELEAQLIELARQYRDKHPSIVSDNYRGERVNKHFLLDSEDFIDWLSGVAAPIAGQ